jgi:2-amino-4-hydroxy-6-hydroxymethyldihydropteridine diphosphokinase
MVRQSSWQLTLPVGGRSGQREFLNGAVLAETSRSPHEVLALLQQIENEFGRERQSRWGDRTLDLDLLLHGDTVIDTPALTVPHPRMSYRRFVLEPVVEIAAEMLHPTIGWSLERLLDQLESGADYLALVSTDDETRQARAAELLVQFKLEIGTAPVDDSTRWPATSTTWLSLPTDNSGIGDPKLTIVIGDQNEHVPGRGPTLRVPAADGQAADEDVFAAIEAVWPRLGRSAGKRLQ